MKLTKRRAARIRYEILLARNDAVEAGFDPEYDQMQPWPYNPRYLRSAYIRTYMKTMDKYIASLSEKQLSLAREEQRIERMSNTDLRIYNLELIVHMQNDRITELEKKNE